MSVDGPDGELEVTAYEILGLSYNPGLVMLDQQRFPGEHFVAQVQRGHDGEQRGAGPHAADRLVGGQHAEKARQRSAPFLAEIRDRIGIRRLG